MTWHPRTFAFDEEPDPDYDAQADLEAWEEAAIERAESARDARNFETFQNTHSNINP